MNAKSERMQILEMIESGRISASQGLALLQALAGSEGEDEPALPAGGLLPIGDDQSEAIEAPPTAHVEEVVSAIPLPPPASSNSNTAPGEASSGDAIWSSGPAEPLVDSIPASTVWEPLQTPVETPLETPEPQMPPIEERSRPGEEGPHLPDDAVKWRRWWAIPLWVGFFVAVWGGLFMFWSLRAAGGISLWFLCASIPFSLGVLVVALGLLSFKAPWVHLRVQQKPGEKPERIAISFPLPVRPVAWFLNVFGGFIPQVRENSIDEMILAVGQNATRDNPIYIQVDEDDGEKVEIYIG